MRIETWYSKQNAMSFFIGLMPVGKYVEYNHHPNFACECDVTSIDYLYLSSTSLPGGNQVDGLPLVSSCELCVSFWLCSRDPNIQFGSDNFFPVHFDVADAMV